MYDRYGEEGPTSAGSVPGRPGEVQLFGDRIAQSLSIHNGVVYSVEGPEYARHARRPPVPQRESQFNWGSVPRRTRTNNLAAWDLETGKYLWRQPPAENPLDASRDSSREADSPDDPAIDDDPFMDVGFMGAPVGYGKLILVPVNSGGSIWLYAMDAENSGALVWRSYLCDEPSGGSQAWSPIQLALDGSTVYAVCGTGVVFAVDAMTGVIRFARRYPRTGEPNNLMQRFGNQMELLDLDGWQEDLAIPVNEALVVFASDYNAAWAIDPQTAGFLWRVENRPFGHKFDYVIGVHGDLVYVGGKESVAAFSLSAQGRWEWVYALPELSLGQAMLTADALYVPLKDSIQKLGLAGRDGDGDVLGTFPVELGTDAPVGNLYSDGDKIWVTGGNRLYVLDEKRGE
jgi:outer membrane protein assembly factor BamB